MAKDGPLVMAQANLKTASHRDNSVLSEEECLIGGLLPRETKGANINCLDERCEQHAVSLTSGRHTRARTNLAGIRSKIRSRSMITRHSLLQLPGLDHDSPADGVAG
ncbi:MAG: hypothetical protein WCK86_08960 [Planctomycetia bacterium]